LSLEDGHAVVVKDTGCHTWLDAASVTEFGCVPAASVDVLDVTVGAVNHVDDRVVVLLSQLKTAVGTGRQKQATMRCFADRRYAGYRYSDMVITPKKR
jgi:hypothetical protein